MLSQGIYVKASEVLGVGIAEIKAVAKVESGGSGFLKNGLPKILFEPHVFYRRLVARGIKPSDYTHALITEGNLTRKVKTKYATILYESWGEQPYGRVGEQHERLELAAEIHREAALESASWGLFQIMGYHYVSCDCKTIQEFVNKNYESEEAQFMLFVHFIKTKGYEHYLRNHQWDLFARNYNGAGYKKNNYDTKLLDAYRFYKTAGV